MGSGIPRSSKVLSGLNIRGGLIVSLAGETIPLNGETAAISFDDYLRRVEEAAKQGRVIPPPSSAL
jgi:hypothetical protein